MSRNLPRTLAEAILRWTGAGLPDPWGPAMAAECEQIEGDWGALAWAAGCGKVAVMNNLRSLGLVYALLLALGVAAVIWFEWHTDEVTVVLALLLSAAAALGFYRPAGFVLTGLAIGAAVPGAHLASMLSGRFPPPYQTQLPSTGDLVMMATLVVFALAAAFVGGFARRRLGPVGDR